MANLQMTFDPTAVDPDTGREPIPAGEYKLCVVESDVQPAKSGNGLILKLVMEVMEGEFNKRRIFEQLNIQHTNQQAMDIAQRQLSALCRAAEITSQITDSEELHFQPFRAKVGFEPAKGEFKARNKIDRYIFAGDQAPPAGKAAPQAAPAQAPAQTATATVTAQASKQVNGGGSRPWAR